MLTTETFRDAITLLGARWPAIQEPALQAVYLEYLRDLTDAEFWPAVKRAAAEHEFLPTAKTIRDLARPPVDAKVEGGDVFTNILHDATVKQYTPQHGSAYSLSAIAAKYGDPAAHAVVSIGGCRALASLTEASEPFVRKEFAAAYDAYTREQAARVTGARLGAPQDRPRLAAAGGERVLRLERAGAVLDRMLPPGDRPG